jgi:hypothetical protein
MRNKKAPKVEIRCNQWGNWYGYESGRKVKEFYRTPEHSQQEAAQRWLTVERLRIQRYWGRPNC